MVHVGGAVQPLHAAELVGALLDFVGRDHHALTFRGVHGQLVAHHLLDQPFELPGQLEQPHEFLDVEHLVVDTDNASHV
ncbi:hypothetical protein D9M69_230350 [compost metagenome]